MATYRTPGVYIEEKDAFSTSIVAVPTAVPAFIGYTEKAKRGTKSLSQAPTRINSFAEYLQFFGGAPKTKFTVSPDAKNTFKVDVIKDTLFYLFNSIKLFYTNGGGPCYIVSVGEYEDHTDPAAPKATKKDAVEIEKGIEALLKFPEPTMVVIPDAVLLATDIECFGIQKLMIDHCGNKTRSRVAILDVYDTNKIDEINVTSSDIINKFREGVGNRTLDFAAAYYPWLNTTVTSANEVSHQNVDAASLSGSLKTLLDAEADAVLKADPANKKLPAKVAALKGKIGELTSGKPLDKDQQEITDEAQKKVALKNLEEAIKMSSELYRSVLKDIREDLNVLPPSGAIAGLYSYVDSTEGVARSPANFSLNSVLNPTLAISNEEQEDLNVPLDGKALNAIRSFPGKGPLVWGARTLNGNSQDWRYISVRRAVIMMEQSVKIALGAFVFKPNVQNTWLDVQSSITNFLTAQWNNGVLAGAVPSDAFSVAVGLGVTMTPQDILDGYMRVEIKLAVVRPAEFIVVTFQQQMQKS